ncbi:hypothetical protein SKDZ_15G1300 [Saccharomyces kudriavzevii ZP591]|uniref:YOL024W-like protein n=1 Tax=Saccharomyces cerevisiae x Saccharomyces kudriavzevii (strain VIN7) TaxID=1095631 RepID=H0H0W2_SACCK|nr:YOL024W-like protein [Saccharomyces cerevisiae x Saccharomyces kudriavzevii VIN7]CAI4051086.1 hypothetical protein SKDZ_15G1300 [Saccharomyces kudriavzevii ZP591]
MSKLSIYPQLSDFTNLEEPPEPKEFFQDLCGFPTFSEIHLSNSQRSTNYCDALNHSRQKFPTVFSKMTLRELRHDMSTFSLQEKEQMNIYDAYKVIDMGDHVLFETLCSKPGPSFEKSHINKSQLKAEAILDEPPIMNIEFQPSSSAQNSSIFFYEDYKKFIYQQLDMFG